MTEIKKIETIITAPSEEVLAKSVAWSKMGELVHNANISLQARAQTLKMKLFLPQTIEDVNEARAILDEVKKGTSDMVEERKLTTGKFKKPTESLMSWEKSMEAPIAEVTAAILKLTQADAARVKGVQDGIAHRAKLKELSINAINIAYDQFYKEISEKINVAYKYALEKKIKVEKIGAYVDKLKAFFTVENFTMTPQPGSSPESIAVWNEAVEFCNKPTPEQLLEEYHKKCTETFEFYSTALLNVEGAIAAKKIQEEAEAADRASALLNAKVNATLETQSDVTAQNAVISTTVKETKKRYVLDAEDGEISAIIIITAFMQNFNKAKGGIRVKEWFNLSVGQMGAALAWMKNEDENVNFSGINFKIEEKI